MLFIGRALTSRSAVGVAVGPFRPREKRRGILCMSCVSLATRDSAWRRLTVFSSLLPKLLFAEARTEAGMEERPLAP
jgi:hypothetical protein